MANEKIKLRTPEFRASYAYVWTPKTDPDKPKPWYEVTMVIPKTTDISTLTEECKRVVNAKWPDVTKRPKGLINPIKDGDTWLMDDGVTLKKEKHPEWAGCWVICAKSNRRPSIVQNNNGKIEEILDPTEFQSGDYAIATIDFYAYDNTKNPKSKNGVSVGLNNIFKTKTGEHFASGGSSAEDDFNDLVGSGTSVTKSSNVFGDDCPF